MRGKAKELSVDPTAGVTWDRPDDRFVPVRACELVDALANDAGRFGLDMTELRDFAAALSDVIDQEALSFCRSLSDTYAAFNPDRDTKPLGDLATVRTPKHYDALLAQLDYLLDKANFTSFSDVDIDAALKRANSHGLRIRLRPERIERITVYVRGSGVVERMGRHWRYWRRWTNWRHLVHGVPYELPVYRRMAVVAQLHDDPHVHIKLFKDIPEDDIEALLPHAEVDMSWQDRLIVFGGGAGALGSTASKLMGLASGVAAISQLMWVVLVGTVSLGFRTIMGYRRARKSRDSQRTRHLYFQNLANNAAALQMLIAIVAQEEMKEALLAYVLAADAKASHDATRDLDRAVEAYLRERFDAELNFDATDAVETLRRLELLASDRPLRVIPPAEATALLQTHHESRRSAKYHSASALRGVSAGDGSADLVDQG